VDLGFFFQAVGSWQVPFGRMTFGLEGIALAPAFLRPSVDGLDGAIRSIGYAGAGILYPGAWRKCIEDCSVLLGNGDPSLTAGQSAGEIVEK